MPTSMSIPFGGILLGILIALLFIDSDETSLQTCDKALQPDYIITFCPDPVTKITPPPSEDPSYAATNVCVPVSTVFVAEYRAD